MIVRGAASYCDRHDRQIAAERWSPEWYQQRTQAAPGAQAVDRTLAAPPTRGKPVRQPETVYPASHGDGNAL
jgi:hypothetical protein